MRHGGPEVASRTIWGRQALRWVAPGVCWGTIVIFVFGCRSVDPRPKAPSTTGSVRTLVAGTAVSSSAEAEGVTSKGDGRIPRPLGERQQEQFATVVTAGQTEDGPGPAAGTDLPIDLGTALLLAGVDNPTIGLARERVREALATELAARSLLLPSVNVGGNFYLHRGELQASSGRLITVDRQSLYLGAGARAAGTSTVTVPGVWLFAHLGDAAFEPAAARQQVAARRSEAGAVQNAILRDVATAYLGLVGAEARLDILRRSGQELAEVVRLTRVYADRGQGRRADADRATANDELLNRQVREAEEDVAVASARLCRLLNVAPSARLRTPGGGVQTLRLVSEETEAEVLVAEGLRSRPEISARLADVREAQTRVRQEQVRPWLPVVSVGLSGGAVGGGSSLAASEFGPLSGRSNFDVAAVWQAENLGFGNQARVRRAGAGVGQAMAGYELTVNQVRREVTESLAEARATARQIETARAAAETASEGYRLETERIREGLGRPIETLDSFRQLLDSRLELVRAVIAFDVAQFRLYVAVGNTPLVTVTPNGVEAAP
ncbi:MAG: TolC family protein [Gemmataceae bacterium]